MSTERQSCLDTCCACGSGVNNMVMKAFPGRSPEYDPTFKPVDLLKPVLKDDGSNLIEMPEHRVISQKIMEETRRKQAEAELKAAKLLK